MLTIDTVARLLLISDEQVLTHIRAGRLAAVNVGGGSKRPRWRISQAALDDFLAARTTHAPTTSPRRRKHAVAGTEFF